MFTDSFTAKVVAAGPAIGKKILAQKSPNFDGYIIQTVPPRESGPYYLHALNVISARSEEALIAAILKDL